MMYVSRNEILPDALADLPTEQREQLRHSERNLVEYLANQNPGETQDRHYA